MRSRKTVYVILILSISLSLPLSLTLSNNYLITNQAFCLGMADIGVACAIFTDMLGLPDRVSKNLVLKILKI